MSKIMAKVKNNYNSFPELQIKFFHKQCGHFHRLSKNFMTVSKFLKFQLQVILRKKVTTSGIPTKLFQT